MKKTLTILLILLAGIAYGQLDNPLGYTWYKYSYGTRIDRGWFDKAIHIPRDTIYTKSGLAIKGSSLYFGDSTKWYAVGTGSGSFNTSLGTGYKFAVDGTNNVKSILPFNGLTGDSATGGQVGMVLGSVTALTQYTPITLNGFPLTINHNGVDSTAQSDSNTLRLTNNTAATGITSAVTSPGIMFKTSGWRTAGSTAKDQRFMIDATGLSTTAINGNSLFRIRANPNNVGYSTIFSISAAGIIQQNLNVNGTLFGTAGTALNNLKAGELALMAITTGSNNVAVGTEVLENHKTGDENTAVGYAAMIVDTSGANNTAIGARAMFLNKNGSDNTAVGQNSLRANTTGTANTAVGMSALGSSTASSNTAVGHSAMSSVGMTGGLNTAVGVNALKVNTTGNQNAAFGMNALLAATTAIKNVALGAGAMEKTTTGGFNTAGGEDVMLNNLTGINNTAFGYLSLATMTAGNGNVSLGYIAGTTFTSGDNNIWIGNQAGTHASQALAPTNSIAIGYNSFTTASNQIVIGNSSHTTAKFFGIPSGVGTKAVRYDPSTNELTYGDTTSGGGSGSGTVNTGAANKATYYPSAGTTVDDFIGVEYGLTNNTMRLLPQAVGDTALVILAKASQTAPLLVAQNSAGLAQFKIWENGYIGNSIYKLYPVEFHTNVGGVYARFGTNFAFATAPENSQVGYGAFGRTDGSEVGLYKYDATGGIGFYVNGITTPKVYLAASNSNLGIGTGTTVSARLHSLSTTEQLRLGYDASNYLSTTIGSTGGTTFDAIGAGSIFNFSDNVTITNNSLNGNQLYVSSTSTAVNGPASLVRADFSGANAAASVSTYGGFFNNSRTGTTSLTYGVYGQASDGTTNYGVFGQASGGTTAIGGNFTVSGASNNYPIITAGGNSGFNTANPTSVLHTTSFATAYRAITALRTLDITDHTIEVTSGTFTVTLPTAVGITGRQYIITNSGAGTTTIATTSSQTFVNVTATPTTLTVNQYGVVTVVSNGANWLRTSSLGFGLFVLIVLLPTLVFRRRNFLDDCYKQAA